eukprot:SAG31_NODE_32903_length_350_cov_1.000000_1_plen_35_part_10
MKNQITNEHHRFIKYIPDTLPCWLADSGTKFSNQV